MFKEMLECGATIEDLLKECGVTEEELYAEEEE